MKIYGVTGWKNSGKTGLMERLVVEIITRGLSVSTVKHAHHNFDVDQPGKDSHRHRHAGAKEVLLCSSKRFTLMHEIRDSDEPSLTSLLDMLSPVDLVLIEGYKRDLHPKIEAYRKETGQKLSALNDPTIEAVAANQIIKIDKPVFDLDDTVGIANFILAQTGF